MATSLLSETAAEARTAHVPSHGRGRLRPFQPGQSGNPSGKGGAYHEAQRICRDASPAAARRLVALMDDADSRVALMAADRVLDRAWGKPRDAAPDLEAAAADTAKRAEARERFMALIERMADCAAKPAV